MSSIAALYKRKDTVDPLVGTALLIDLHTNYWKMPSGYGNYNRFLDIGIKVYDAKDLESVLLYVPFKDENLKNRLHDLGEVITEKNFLSILFNDDFEIYSDSQTPAYKFAKSKSNSDNAFWIYELKGSNFDVHQLPNGSLIEIKFLTHPTIIKNVPVSDKVEKDNYALYVRFRIDNLQIGEMSTLESVSNDAFQSFFSKSEMINIHVNSVREIDDEDFQLLKAKYQFLLLHKCHFYFVGSSEDESVHGLTSYKDCILWDANKWGKYIGLNNPENRNCVAYHWIPEINSNHCQVFVKTVFSSTSKKKILWYILLMIFMGIIASWVSNNIPTIYKNHLDIPDNTLVLDTINFSQL